MCRVARVARAGDPLDWSDMDIPTVKDETARAPGEVAAVGVEAYVFLYPLVLMELTRRQMTNLPAGERPGFAPMGEFAHVREFPPADFRAVVRPNFDTLYSAAWLDLSQEPAIVSAPDTDGRYYLLPMLDMWTDVFAAPGKRTTGTHEGDFAVVPPGWRGELPEGVVRIDAPTSYVWIIGRTQTNGPGDYAAVAEVQDGMKVTRLSRSGAATTPAEAPADPGLDMVTPPLDQINAMSGREFFTLAAELLERHAPHVTDWSTVARIRRLGLGTGDAFDYDELAPTIRAALDGAPAAGLQQMRDALPLMARIANGWQMNTDSMGVYGNHYLKRAIVAMVGLGANQPQDAIYPLNVADADGRPLDGDQAYVLHFEPDELPPVEAFWSLTMYDADGFQAANELDRFALGDRDELAYGDDGSLELYLQHENPGPERESNWLPAPRGPLGVTMRLYAPEPEALDGRWNPPPIRRVG